MGKKQRQRTVVSRHPPTQVLHFESVVSTATTVSTGTVKSMKCACGPMNAPSRKSKPTCTTTDQRTQVAYWLTTTSTKAPPAPPEPAPSTTAQTTQQLIP